LLGALKQDVPPPKKNQLPLELTSLALFVRQQVVDAIKGFRKGPSPANFAALSSCSEWLGDVFTGWVAEVFRFRGVVPTASQWIDEFKNFGPLVARSTDIAVRQPAVLLLRLFYPDLLAPGLGRSSWRDKVRYTILDKNHRLLVRNREVLEAPLSTWAEWDAYPHLVKDPDDLLVEDAGAVITLQVTAVVERLLARFDGSEPSEAARIKWIDDLAMMLLRITEPGFVDRFVMVRLVDLAISPVLRGRDDTRLAVVRFLVERAGSTALQRLTQTLLRPPVDDQMAVVWPSLRIAILRGLLAKARLRASESASPRNPVYLLQGALEARSFEQMAQLFLVGATGDVSEAEVAQLRKEYLRMEHEGLNGFGKMPVHAVHDPGEGNIVVECEKEAPRVENWMLSQAVEEPDTGEFELVFDVRKVPPPPRHRNDPRLAFFMGRDEQKIGIAVDCDGGWHQGIESYAQGDLLPGTPVSLDPAGKAVEPLKIPMQVGDVPQLQVSRRSDPNESERLEVQLCVGGAKTSDTLDVDLDLWDPDLSRHFWDQDAVPRVVPAAFDEDGKWVPIRRGLSAFLCRSEEPRGTRRATLTFLKRTHDSDGAEQWLFAGSPGDLFEFRVREFTEESAKEIKNQLKDIGRPSACAGLLISVEAILIADQVRLTLMKNPWVEAMHPQLRCPFDRRNIEWRQQFEEDSFVRVEREEGSERWWVRSDVGRGFPPRLRAFWLGPQPANDMASTNGSLCDWRPGDQRKARLPVRKTGCELNLTILPRLFTSLSTLERGVVRELEEPHNREIGEASEVACFTVEGLCVLVPLDSLTLLPVTDDGDAGKFVKCRSLRFEEMKWQDEEVVQLIFQEELPSRLHEGWNTGFLVATPSKSDTGGLTTVLFELTTELCGVRISGNTQPLYPGNRLNVEIRRGLVCKATIQRCAIYATGALWTIESAQEPEQGAFFVGECSWNKKGMLASESSVKPGILRLTPSGVSQPYLFARWDTQTKAWLPSPVGETWRAVNTDRTGRFKFQNGRKLFRVRLQPRGRNWIKDLEGASLAGLCSRSIESHHCRVLRIHLKLEQTGTNEAAVWRVFDVDAHLAVIPEEKLIQVSLDERLESLAKSEPIQRCQVDKEGTSCKLDELKCAGFSEQQSTLAIAKNGGTWVTNGDYDSRGRGYLDKIDNRWVIDFRRVPPLTLEEYQKQLEAEPGEPQFANLVIVGPIAGTERDRQPHDWRFEAGYGLSVIVSEDRLLSNGLPFNLRHLLFHGDTITEFTFVEVAGPENGGLILKIDIKDVAIEPAPATVLYRQAASRPHGYNMVHQLRLSLGEEGTPNIEAIMGCDERGIESAEHQFKVPHAKLDEKSATQLASSLTRRSETALPEEEGVEIIIYGRMDVKAFSDSQGREVLFEHVHLKTGLHDGDLLLLQAVRLEPGKNDVFLQFDDVAGEPEDSIVVKVSRRKFSRREALLRRLLEDGGEFNNAVCNHIFAVRLDGVPDRYGSWRGSVRDDLPDRRNQAFRDRVGSISEPVFAVVDGIRQVRDRISKKTQALRLEHRPGIFFSLKATDFSGGTLPGLDEGTLVQVLLNGDGKFQLMICSYGDRAYLETGSRNVVALPLNPLFQARAPMEAQRMGDEWWGKRGNVYPGFSLGDFPETTCLAKSERADRRICNPSSARMFEFMGRRHPKIGTVIFDQGLPVLIPNMGTSVAGSLRISSDVTQDPVVESGVQKWPPKFGPVAKLDFSGSAGHEIKAEP